MAVPDKKRNVRCNPMAVQVDKKEEMEKKRNEIESDETRADRIGKRMMTEATGKMDRNLDRSFGGCVCLAFFFRIVYTSPFSLFG